MPFLLDLQELNEAQISEMEAVLMESVANQEPAPLSVLISADCTATRLHHHLRQVQVIDIDGKPAWLRLVDARVWAQLPRLVTRSKLQQLLGPIQSWACHYYLQWIETRMDLEDLAGDKHFPAMAVPGMLRVGLINRALAQNGMTTWQEAIRFGAELDQLFVRVSRAYALERTEDLVNFAVYALQHGFGFDSHPVIQRLREKIIPNETNIVDLLAVLDEESWLQIRQQSAHFRQEG